jgi:hypothetical protein
MRSRNEQLFNAYVGRTVVMTLILGLLMWQVGPDNDQQGVQTLLGGITIVFLDQFFTCGMGLVQSVPFAALLAMPDTEPLFRI